MKSMLPSALAFVVSTVGTGAATGPRAPAGFVSLSNGRDLSGWKIPEGDNGHWKVIDGRADGRPFLRNRPRHDVRTRPARDPAGLIAPSKKLNL